MSASGRGWKVVGQQAQRRHRVLKEKTAAGGNNEYRANEVLMTLTRGPASAELCVLHLGHRYNY